MTDRRGPARTPLAVAGVVVLALALGAGVVASNLLGTRDPAAVVVPLFVDETGSAGLDFTWDGELRYAVGGGVAVLDCDDDGFADLFFAGGAGPAALFRNASMAGGPLRFERVAEPVTDLASVNGAYPIDIDDDGIADLVTLRHGENVALAGPRRLPLRAGQRALGPRRRRRADGCVQRDLGGRQPAPHAGLRQLRGSRELRPRHALPAKRAAATGGR